MDYQSSYDELTQNFEKFKDHYIEFSDHKDNMKLKVIQYIENVKVHLSSFKLNHLNDSLLSKSQCILVRDIINELIKKVCNGNFYLSFDLQYTNPQKDNFRPGRPLEHMSDKSKEWFEDKGFTVKYIKECFGVSKSCEFGCNGDGIGRILISWKKPKKTPSYLNFTAEKCHQISFLLSSINELIN